MIRLPEVKKNSFYKSQLISGAVALHSRYKDMPLAEGDTTYELKGGINNQSFVMTGNVAETPSYGSGELKGGWLRTYCTGVTISGTAQLPQMDIYALKEGAYPTEPDTTNGWNFPTDIGTNIAVYSSYFDSGEVWMADYFDGADKNLVVSTIGTAGEVNGLEDVYLSSGDWLPTFMGGGNFPWGGNKNQNIRDYFSTKVGDEHRCYVRPLRKSRMKGLWTATIDTREQGDGKATWQVKAPFWKWDKIQPLLRYGEVPTPPEDVEKDATTNNTIFNHIAKSGDLGNPFTSTKNSPLLQSVVEISNLKAKTGGTSLRIYHQWPTSSSANSRVEQSLGTRKVNGQIAKCAMWDLPVPIRQDLGAMDFIISGSDGPAKSLTGTWEWVSGSAYISGSETTEATTELSTGSRVRIGPQDYNVVKITDDRNFVVDRPPASGAAHYSNVEWGNFGPVSAGSAKTIYKLDTPVAKSFVSGAHLTDKHLVKPEINITMNISKLPPSPAINPQAHSKYVGNKGRIYWRGGRATSLNNVPNSTEYDLDLSGSTEQQYWSKGGPLTSLLRSVVVTFSSYKSDSFDTLDDFIDYGMNRYYIESHTDPTNVLDTQQVQNDTQLCGIVFQRDYGNAESIIADPNLASIAKIDTSVGHIYAYALPVTKWVAPYSYGTNGGTCTDLNPATADGTKGAWGVHAAGGMGLIDNTAETKITDNQSGSADRDSGIKQIVVQPKYDQGYWDPDLAGVCSISKGGSGSGVTTTSYKTRKSCEEGLWVANEGYKFTNGSPIVQVTGSVTTCSAQVGALVTSASGASDNYANDSRLNTEWSTNPANGLRVTEVDTSSSPQTFTMSAPFTGNTTTASAIVQFRGVWTPHQYTNINGTLEPHWVKIPLDEFFTMKFLWDKDVRWGHDSTNMAATFSYRDMTTGLPSDYCTNSTSMHSESFGVPLRCYFEGATTGSTLKGGPIKQAKDKGPSGSAIEELPYINVPLMFHPQTEVAYQAMGDSADNTKGMAASYPKHMTIWVNNYRYTTYEEGDSDAINSLFLGATYSGTTASDAEPNYLFTQGDSTDKMGRRRGADEIMFGNASAAYASNTETTEYFLNPEVEVFVDNIELKHFNHTLHNNSIQAGKMQQFINMENNEILSPVTTYTDNTCAQGGMRYSNGNTDWIPTTSNTAVCSVKGMDAEGKLTPVNPGYNLSIGFIEPPGSSTGFPISGGSGEFGTGDVFDIYCLLNSFQTPQFGRINQISPSAAWTPQAGNYSTGVLDGAGTNYARILGATAKGRQFAHGMIISGGASTNDNRAAWAGHGFGGGSAGPIGYSPDYAGYAYWPVEAAAGIALDGKLSFGSGSNTYFSCDGFTQKGFFRMSRDMTTDTTAGAGATIQDRWAKAPNQLVAAKILGVQGSHQFGAGDETTINSNSTIMVDNPEIFSVDSDDTYLIYRVDKQGAGYDQDGTTISEAKYMRNQLGYVNTVKLSAPSDETTAIPDNMIELVVTDSDGDAISTGILYADDDSTELCVAEHLSELWISPLRYWVNMSFINNNLDYRRTYESINPINKAPSTTADPSPLGSTFNEWIYSYSTGATGTKGLSGIYEKPWILGTSEETSLIVDTDYGYGSFDAETNTGGQLGKATALLGQYVEADISGIVGGGTGGGMGGMSMMGGGASTAQPLNIYAELSNVTASKLITLVGDDATGLRDDYLPTFVWEFHDSLPEISEFAVSPAFDGLQKDVNLYDLTTQNLNALKFTWKETGDDIWYRMLMVDTEDIKNKYHKCSFHLPLNEYKQDGVSVGNKPQYPLYYYYNYVGGTYTNTVSTDIETDASTECPNSIAGLAGYAFGFGKADASADTTKAVPRISYNATPTANNSQLLALKDEYTFVIHAIPATSDASNYLFDQSSYGVDTGFEVYLDSAKKVVAKHRGVTLQGTSIQLCDGEQPLNVIVTFKTGAVQAGRQPLELYVNGTLEDYSIVTGTTAVSAPASGATVGGQWQATTNKLTWDGLIEEVLIYDKRWAVVADSKEYIFNTEALAEKDAYTSSGIAKTQNAKMFLFDYHNIRGKASDEVCQSNLVGWKVTSP